VRECGLDMEKLERKYEVIGVGAFLLTPVFLFMLGCGLLLGCNIIP